MSVEMKTFVCETCNVKFQHPKQRGRPPKRCPEHRGSPQTASKPQKAEVKVTVTEGLLGGKAVIVEDEPPKTRGRTAMVCGWCGGAPTNKDHSASHLRCPGTHCACAEVNHKPNAAVRSYQSKYTGLTVAECIEKDAGL